MQIPQFGNEDYSQGVNFGGKNSKLTKFRFKTWNFGNIHSIRIGKTLMNVSKICKING